MAYDTSYIQEARRLYAVGWTVAQITKRMRANGCPRLSDATVKAWVDDDYRIVRNHISSEDRRLFKDKSGDYARRRVRELHHRGLSLDAIQVVLDIYHGRNWSSDEIRGVL